MHTHTVRCPIPTCDHAVEIEPPIEYVPSFLQHETHDVLQRRTEVAMREHADTHTGSEWWSACNYYVAHLDREVARSHARRLRVGPAVWSQPTGQLDVKVVHVGEAGIMVEVGGAQMSITDPDMLGQVAMLQVRHG